MDGAQYGNLNMTISLLQQPSLHIAKLHRLVSTQSVLWNQTKGQFPYLLIPQNLNHV
jgi:hypothetical protein